ncbi:hypothetical protein DFJ58DRAFT_635430, partial [Suillus subalutaceus]|uniref:uncharacterized protein n=1 Tax=Suillus subalutaceus TaxID=48586 RepID=UPI001B863344
GLSKGNNWKLTEFITSHKETLCIDYARLSRAQKDNYEVEIMKMCANKQCMVHDNPRAVQRDMQATFAAMNQEVLSIFFATHIPTMLKVKKSLNQLVSECRTLIQDKLDFILRENILTNHVKMNYKNYKHAIVEHYGVELKG